MFEKPDSGVENDPKKISRREFLKRASAVAVVNLSGCAVLSDPEAESPAGKIEKQESYETQLKNWRAFQEIVSDPRLKETMAFLNDTYKGADSNISFKALWDIQTNESLEMVEREMIAQDKTISDSQLGCELLKQISESYTQFWSQADLTQRIEAAVAENGLTAAFVGFENMQFINGETLTNDEVRELIESRFPNKRWLYETIGTFQYKHEQKETGTYGIAGEAVERSIQNTLAPGKEQKVIIYDGSRPYEKYEFLDTIGHEIAHHHDWVGTLRLPLHERLEFLKDVTEHFQNPDRFQTYYVDKLIPEEIANRKNSNSAESVMYEQVVEYWASINETYDTSSNFGEVFPADADLIQKWRERLVAEE